MEMRKAKLHFSDSITATVQQMTYFLTNQAHTPMIWKQMTKMREPVFAGSHDKVLNKGNNGKHLVYLK